MKRIPSERSGRVKERVRKARPAFEKFDPIERDDDAAELEIEFESDELDDEAREAVNGSDPGSDGSRERSRPS